MTVEQLRKFHATRPFVPFILHLADRRSLRVRHPEFMAYAGGRTVAVAQPDDTFEVVDLLLIASIEVKNGKSSRRGRPKHE